MAFLPSTRIPLFTFQHLFSLNFRLYLFASEVHPLAGVSPCHCNQVRVTGHGLSSLIVKFLIFIFFSGLGIVSWYHSFLKTTYFTDCTCNQLGHPPITCQHLSISCFDYCQKFFLRIFNSFSQKFQFYTSWQLYLATQTFWLNPSHTAIDQYCHKITGWELAVNKKNKVSLYITGPLALWVECSPMSWDTGVWFQVESYHRLKKNVT